MGRGGRNYDAAVECDSAVSRGVAAYPCPGCAAFTGLRRQAARSKIQAERKSSDRIAVSRTNRESIGNRQSPRRQELTRRIACDQRVPLAIMPEGVVSIFRGNITQFADHDPFAETARAIERDAIFIGKRQKYVFLSLAELAVALPLKSQRAFVLVVAVRTETERYAQRDRRHSNESTPPHSAPINKLFAAGGQVHA